MGKEEVKLKEYSFEIQSTDDTSETVGSVGEEYSSVYSDEKFYRKEDVDALLAEKDKEIKQLEYLLHISTKQVR
jgi:GDP-D-mannose dehydratase